ncbi:MAG TPA: peptidoglycan-binding protein [Ancylobacter sp.]
MASVGSVVAKLAPRANAHYLAAFAAHGVIGQFEAYEIDTPLRLAHFLAQVFHESGGLKLLRESGNYKAPRIVEIFGVGVHSAAVTKAEAAKLAGNGQALFERVYGLGNPKKARELGNLKAGDAWKYRGGGLMQNTGGDAYRRYGFADDPDAITSAARCLEPALKVWKEKGCNALADRNDIREITHRINGGYNGYDDRVAWFNRAWPLLNTASEAESWKVAQPAEGTRLLQQQLVELGYDIKVDGRIGPKTTAAIVAFQKANGLRADGIAGDITKATISARLAGTAPATGSAMVPDKPSIAAPTASGLTLLTISEGGQKLIDQAGLLQSYAGLTEWMSWGAAGLTTIGVAIIMVGVVRTYVLPAIWPAKAAVPA